MTIMRTLPRGERKNNNKTTTIFESKQQTLLVRALSTREVLIMDAMLFHQER